MKSLKKSFLFFYFYYLCQTGCFVNSVNAQQAIDSTWYYYDLITEPKNNDDLVSGYLFFNNHKENSLYRKDTIAAIYDLRMIIIGQYKLALPYDSEASVVEALNLIDHLELDDSSIIADKIGLYNSLGRIYRSLNDYDKAIEIYDTALIIAQEISDSMTLYNNKATIYRDQGRFQLAREKFEYVYINRLKFDTNKMIAKALDNLGSVQGKLGEPKGLTNMLNALEIRKEEQDYQSFYISYKHLTEYYRDRDNFKTARYYARLGYEATSIYRQPYKMEAIANLLLLEDNPLNKEYIKLNDSLTEARLSNDKKFSSAKYNLTKEQGRTIESELAREKEKSKRLQAQAGIGLIIILGLFTYLYLKAKYKKNTLMEVYNTETRISKKVHDEVANDVFHVMNRLERGAEANEAIVDTLEGIYNKTRDISRENNSIEVSEKFEELLRDLLLSYSSPTVNIITRNISKIEWDAISDIRKMTIYRVLQELMTNMKKHSEASLVVLSFLKAKNKVEIGYTDNGIGLNTLKFSGLQNAENRILSINGTINFETELEKGFKVKIKV